MTDDAYADLAEFARAGRARVLPAAPVSSAPAGSALESLERIAFGDVWNRPGLSSRERRLITLACLGINGTERTVALHARGALDSGDLTREDLDAFTLHLGIYAGFPRAAAFAASLDRVYADLASDGSPDADRAGPT